MSIKHSQIKPPQSKICSAGCGIMRVGSGYDRACIREMGLTWEWQGQGSVVYTFILLLREAFSG